MKKDMDGSAWAGMLGQKWAKNWALTDRTFDGLTQAIEDIAEREKFSNVLDIGCGAGELVIRMADKHKQAQFIGNDICPELIDQAKIRNKQRINSDFVTADAAIWVPESDEKFDLILARHVMMFFQNPPAALAHLAKLASDNGRVVFSCFRTNEENVWIEDILGQLPPSAMTRIAKGKPSPLAFADPEWVRKILSENGWRDIEIEPFNYGMIVGEGDDPISAAISYLMDIGPASFAAPNFTPEEMETFVGKMRVMLEKHFADGKVALPAAIWLVSARRA